MRGTGIMTLCFPANLRITPACAGNSRGHRQPDRGNQDHPRVCGEQQYVRVAWMVHLGSPPRVRGTEIEPARHNSGARITPACAGNSRPEQLPHRPRTDHPRVCGEQSASLSAVFQTLGSPPRVRGTVPPACMRRYLARITPACAGNRGVRGAASATGEDHPRVCGEQVQSISLSSPL